MRSRRPLVTGLAAVSLTTVSFTTVSFTTGALATGSVSVAGPAASPATFSNPGAFPGPGAGGPCGAFPGARQLPGADGVVPAAWSGGGLVVPACGPAPRAGAADAPVRPYPGAPWTAGYQCVELSERYLYDRFGVTMDIPTNGDQVAAHYAAGYPALFMIIRNGTPHRAPIAGDVISLSAAPGFDSASGGHTAVVQSSSVSAAGDGTVTVVEENADAAGVTVLRVGDWTVRYPGFAFAEWLTATGLTVTAPHPPPASAGRRYSFALTATGGRPPYRWRVTDGTLPAGLTLSAAGTLTGVPRAAPATAGTADWRVTVTDARGAAATAVLALPVAPAPAGSGDRLRYAEWAWHHQGTRRAPQN